MDATVRRHMLAVRRPAPLVPLAPAPPGRPPPPLARLPAAVSAAALVLLLSAAGAQAAIPWAACPTAGFQCAKVDVPLDRSGAVPGTISLAAARAQASSNPNNSAVLALAGGPGQAALGLTQDFAQVLKPAIAN